MTNHEMQPFIIDRILEDLKNASHIKVNCRRCKTNNQEPDASEVEIVSVNGAAGPDEFLHALLYLASNLEKNAMDRQKELEPSQRPFFLAEVNKSIEPLLDIVGKVNHTNLFNDSEPENEQSSLKFKNPSISFETDLLPSVQCIELIIKKTSCYAQTWYMVLKKLCSRLRMLELIVQYAPQEPLRAIATKTPKLVLQTTVSRIAILVRIFFEDNLFENNNKSEICRLFCEYFSIGSKETMSWKSFKNHFDIPDPDDLAFWDDEFDRIKEIVKQLWMTYHAN
jgi:hypothetical protein